MESQCQHQITEDCCVYFIPRIESFMVPQMLMLFNFVFLLFLCPFVFLHIPKLETLVIVELTICYP